ncbi:MAG: hypothetical protein R2834_11335 [Rhodothermales bacterium]
MHVVTPRYSTWRSGAFCLALLLLTHTAFSQSIHRFDFGPEASEIEPGHTLVTPASVFDAGRGFGWSTPPAAAFARPDLYLSRSVATQDGVSGNDLAFDVRAAAGDWWVTLWMEAGLEDSSTVRIAINDEERPAGWLAVHPQAEPRSEIQAIYRVFHDRVTLDTDRFRLRLTAGQDSVRLLALTLVPVQASTTPELAARLAEAGRYPANAPIEALLFDLQAHLATTPNDAWAAQALIALQQLYTAEQLIDLLGWTWADEMTGLGLNGNIRPRCRSTPSRPSPRPRTRRCSSAPAGNASVIYWLARERGGRHERVRSAEDLALPYRRHSTTAACSPCTTGERIARTDACDDLPIPIWRRHGPSRRS